MTYKILKNNKITFEIIDFGIIPNAGRIGRSFQFTSVNNSNTFLCLQL